MDKCPFCGADIIGDNYISHRLFRKEYKCFTTIFNNNSHRRKDCYERQIANLKERLKAWRKGSFYSDGVYILQDNELQKLKDLGEI